MMTSRLHRREFLKSAVLGLGAAALSGCARDTTSPLDVLFLLTDDQRADTLGCMGNPFIQTPNLDSLAKRGALFRNNFVTTSICPTSRASIFTGQYGSQHGIWEFGSALSDAQFDKTYPAIIRKAGYRTGFVGKWGLGGQLPKGRFDYFTGFEGQGKYYEKEGGRHLTARLGDESLAFFDQLAPDQRFCLSVSFKAPHNDAEPPWWIPLPEMVPLYSDYKPKRPATAGDEYFQKLPDALKEPNFFGRDCWQWAFRDDEQFVKTIQGYYGLISGVDLQFKRISDKLRELGRDESTLIVFTSDNGLFLGEHGLCGKWLMHEESIRTPLIIYDPTAREGGLIVNQMTLNIDVTPTLLAAAGLPIPKTVSGRNLLPIVRGTDTASLRAHWFYEHLLESDRIPKVEGVRTDDWKYIVYTSTSPRQEELYYLKKDPREANNLVGDPTAAKRLAELRALHEEYATSLRSPKRAQ